MKPYDLSSYHLTLPVNAKGDLSGDAAEISGASLAAGYQSAYFKNVLNKFTFICPDGGAVTKTAKYARCELRDERSWSHKSHASDVLRASIESIPDGQKVIVHQIHDADEPWVKIVYTLHGAGRGELRALVKVTDGADDMVVSLSDAIYLGIGFTSKIEYKPAGIFTSAKLVLTVNGAKKTIAMKRKGRSLAYFKRGAYFQNNTGKGVSCEVVHF